MQRLLRSVVLGDCRWLSMGLRPQLHRRSRSGVLESSRQPGGDGVGVGDGAGGEPGAGGVHGDDEGGSDGMRGDGVGVGDVGEVHGGSSLICSWLLSGGDLGAFSWR